DGEKFSTIFHSERGHWVLLGVVICLVGFAVCGRAGLLRERELSQATKAAAIREFNLSLGLVVAVVCGILSACFNFGIETGQPMARLAVERGSNPLFQNNVVF